ncbi:hypothetical protein AN161_09485 [Lysinibacillus sp. FJAT-14222]|nr:hypothetical protein AN161_09485 [Lysinibacillus sp. FJAT-14222]
MKKLIRMETGRLLGAHRTPPGSSALRESEASAAMFYLRESEASAAMFYLRAPSRNGNQPHVMMMNQNRGKYYNSLNKCH